MSHRRIALAALVVGALVHLAAVVSIAAQPLDMNARRGSYRSPLWPLFNDSVHRQGPAGDFFALYHAGVKAHRGESPYDGAEAPRQTPYFFHYRYAPGIGVALGQPLARLIPRAAYLVWVVVLELALAGLLLLFIRRAPAPWFAWVSAAALLGSTPFFLEVHMGQFTFVSLALTVAALLALEDAPPASTPGVLGAVGLAASVNLKVFPLVTAPALLRSAAGRVALALAVITFAALNLPSFIAHPELLRQFYELNFLQGMDGFDTGNHGFLFLVFMATRDLGRRWTPQSWRVLASTWQLALLGTTSLLAFASRHRQRALLGGAALLLAHFLSYAHVWEHHYSGVIPVALLVLLALAREPEGDRGPIAIVLASLLVLALPTTFALQDRIRDPNVWNPADRWPHWQSYLPPLCKTVPLLAVFAVAIAALARAGVDLREALRFRDAPTRRSRPPAGEPSLAPSDP
jgi:hypothetical protein